MVETLESTFVVPAEDTPRETLVLSNLDIVMARRHNCSIYLFNNTTGAEDFMHVEVLKSALAKALVLLYPLAGRHFVGPDGRCRINCNAEGLHFVVARLDRDADSIQFEPMTRELRELFIRQEQPSLLQMLQVTYLKCGSVVLGIYKHHLIFDGRSASHVYQIWSTIARGDLANVVPLSFDNTLLQPRSPPKIGFDFPAYTINAPPKEKNSSSSCVLSLLRVSKIQIGHLKSRCNQDSEAAGVTTFSVMAALVWKCYCIAQGLALNTNSNLYITADVRSRLNPPLKEFFGNAVIRIFASSEVSKIMSNPIGNVASIVKATTDKLTDEYVRSFIDYVEVNLKQKISMTEPSESDLRIRTMLRMQLTDIDFGWGAPQLLSLERYTENKVVYLLDDPGKEGCIKVVVALESSIMPRFEKAFYELLSLANM